uniref:Exocyst complex component Sec6 n=1 Tax=Chenopodium quinoa TaxID=63459 RepID=A0A803MDI6_CHEQI
MRSFVEIVLSLENKENLEGDSKGITVNGTKEWLRWQPDGIWCNTAWVKPFPNLPYPSCFELVNFRAIHPTLVLNSKFITQIFHYHSSNLEPPKPSACSRPPNTYSHFFGQGLNQNIHFNLQPYNPKSTNTNSAQNLINYHDKLVNFEDTCKGFLEVAKEGVHQTVTVIFEDPGVQELLVKLYQKEWCEGQVTEYLVATFGDYFADIKMYVEERSFRRFVEACLEETVVVYVDHLLTQKNYIKEETIERMRLDEEVLMDFFREYISVSKVESRVRILSDLRELASAESLDTFTLVYTNILEHQPDCPADVVEKLVSLREGIPRKDAKEASLPCHFLVYTSNISRNMNPVVQECKEIYENSFVGGNPPKAGFVFSRVKCLQASKGSIWRKLT